MIFVDRNKKDSLNNPISPDGNWFQKANEVTKTAIKEGKNHIPLGYIYGHIQVRIALEKLFENKCAYCENFLEESGWNVEHFRPKGRLAEIENHPGYYWLTYDWNNLLPSCIPCNQYRKDYPTWEDRTFGTTGGKVDHFPIDDENFRAFKPEDPIDKESPLLLNPCVDNPEKYFTYDVFGNILVLGDEKKAQKSIEIFNLNRKRLKKRRKIIIEATIAFVKVIEDLKISGDSNYLAVVQLFELKCLAQNCVFSASAKCVKKYPRNFGISVN